MSPKNYAWKAAVLLDAAERERCILWVNPSKRTFAAK
jgi:hypothetical protein